MSKIAKIKISREKEREVLIFFLTLFYFNKKQFFNKKVLDEDSSDTIENDLILITKNIQKSKKVNIEGENDNQEEVEVEEEDEDDDSESIYADLEKDDEPFRIENIDKFEDNKMHKKRLTRHQISNLNKMIKFTESEKKTFSALDDILDSFQKEFSYLTKDQILDIFKKNSFNLENSFLQLSNPKEFEGN